MLVLCGIGKVAAALTTTILIERFRVSQVLFTGVAGSLSKDVQVGDVVVGTHFIQHDMNAQPLFARYLVPGYESTAFAACAQLSQRLQKVCEKMLFSLNTILPNSVAEQIKLVNPKVHSGLILSGDQFISDSQSKALLQKNHPRALAVEMEGAAVAQVCTDFGVNFAVIRTISDSAEEGAANDFAQFLALVASQYSNWLVHDYFANSAMPLA